MLTKNRIKKPFLKHFLEITLIILMELLNIPVLELNNQINMEPRSSGKHNGQLLIVDSFSKI